VDKNDKTKTNICKGMDLRTYTALMPTTVLSTDQRINGAHHGVPLIRPWRRESR